MADSMKEILNCSAVRKASSAYRHAPDELDEAAANEVADQEALSLQDHQWELIRAFQEFFARNKDPKVRELHDALEEKIFALGGLKFLHRLLRGGPVAQGCRLAGAQNKSSGSVQ